MTSPALPQMLAALSVAQFRELMTELHPEPEEVLDSAECAERLKCSAYTLRELTKKGRIPARKLGGEYRYLLSEVLANLPSTVNNTAQKRA